LLLIQELLAGRFAVAAERLDNPPSEKIRIALEEMVSPAIVVSAAAVACARLVGGAHWRAGIADYTSMTIEDAIEAFDQIKLERRENKSPGWCCARSRRGCAFWKP